MSHVKFVHWAALMPNSDKLCNSFHVTGANRCLDFSLSLQAVCGSASWPCRMWPGYKELRFAKESVAHWRRSSAGWMPERTGRLFVRSGRRHPVTMRKASLRTLSMRRVCTLRHQAGAQYSEDAADELARRQALLVPSAIPYTLCLLISRIHSSRFSDWRRTFSSKFFDPQVPPRNLCFLVTLAVCSLVFAATDTAFC